jgi:hypothetical protein
MTALTAAVVALQAALLVMFWLDPSDPPRSGSLWQALWALGHKPSFYPLVGLLVVGPAATWLAMSRPGVHRQRLLVAWAVFLPLVTVMHGHRIYVMLSVLWQHGGA